MVETAKGVGRNGPVAHCTAAAPPPPRSTMMSRIGGLGNFTLLAAAAVRAAKAHLGRKGTEEVIYV